MSKESRKSRFLVVAISAALVLAGFSFWLRQDTESKTNMSAAQLRRVFPGLRMLGMQDYLQNRPLYLRDARGKPVKNAVLLPIPPDSLATDIPASDGGYLGPQACAECHQENYDGAIETAHFRTSAAPVAQNVRGSLEPGRNVLRTSSADLSIEMLQQDGELVQRLVLKADDQSFTQDFPVGIVTGSGKQGQTFLYWQDDHLYQLHASYLTANRSWMNSPGYLDGTADFCRPVPALCLDCHSTYFQPVPETINQYQREHFVLGVTCEKCHGPGREHVEYHRAHPSEEVAKHIVNPDNLSRDHALELCQMCHGGAPQAIHQPAFSYRPGQPLDEYYEFSPDDQVIGVHSNSQLPRLKQSKCFQQSEEMTCADCHNPHHHESGDKVLFSERCIRCHEPQNCGQFDELGHDLLVSNCVDCHMARKTMEDIKLIANGETHTAPMRDHFIKVLEKETREYRESLGK